MSETIPKGEYDSACNMLETILTQRVEEINLTDTIPPINDIADNNQVFKGKLSILFVDMRKSTDLTDELKSKKMVKVYRSFIRMIVQAIRYCGGQSRQFAGDGVMGVFQDNADPDNPVTSCQQAVRAGRYILTLIDYCLNPQLKKHLDDVVIGCGVGICTGTVMATKVGMRGKEADDTAENEAGIVWVGSTTNYASRFCSLTLPREIFIDENTYKGIAADTEHWKKETRVKGTKSFTGYLAKDYYLPLPDEIDIEPVISDETAEADTSFVQRIFDKTEERILHLIDEISKKSAELSLALENVKKREEQVKNRESQATQNETRLGQWQQRLQSKQEDIDDKEKQNKIDEYNLYKKIFELVHCKKAFAIGMDRTFWEAQLKKLIQCGAAIGKSERIVKSEICYALVSLYQDLEMYSEAYQALCIQAEFYPWVHDHTVETIVRKLGAHSQLRGVIEVRLKTSLSSSTRDDLQKCLAKLKSLGY